MLALHYAMIQFLIMKIQCLFLKWVLDVREVLAFISTITRDCNSTCVAAFKRTYEENLK